MIIANNKEDIECMIRKLMEEYKKWGLIINTQKTKYLWSGNRKSGDGRQ